LFKVIEEQQLVFRGGGGGGSAKERRKEVSGVNGDAVKEIIKYEEGSMDRVAAIDEEMFVTGSDNGSLALWSVTRKKPIFTIPLAHGADEPLSLDEAYAEENAGELKDKERPGRKKARWITALTTIPLTDIVLSGSWDGYVRIWRVTPDRRRMEAVGILGSGGHMLLDSSSIDQGIETNGLQNGHAQKDAVPKPIGGIINDLSISERSEKSKVGTNSQASGLCIVAAVSKTHRLGKWHVQKGVKGAKNGAVVFEVPRNVLTNGTTIEQEHGEEKTNGAEQ
jgi:ribosomal RNA-processing protein 9